MNREELTIEELSDELRAMREAPSEEFAAKLDARAAEGFAGGRARRDRSRACRAASRSACKVPACAAGCYPPSRGQRR